MSMKELLLIILLLISKLNTSDGNIIKLFNKYHPYEFIDLTGDTSDFSYRIVSDSKCASSVVEEISSFNEHLSRLKKVETKANVNIYSNSDSDLKFMIELTLEFNTHLEQLNNKKNYEVNGVEVLFEVNGKKSCIQIISQNGKPLTNDVHLNKVKLIIKDPPISTQNSQYTFYFGQISSKSLVKCQNNIIGEYCTFNESQSPFIDVGIKNKLGTFKGIPQQSSKL
jgi:hypothetical protein